MLLVSTAASMSVSAFKFAPFGSLRKAFHKASIEYRTYPKPVALSIQMAVQANDQNPNNLEDDLYWMKEVVEGDNILNKSNTTQTSLNTFDKTGPRTDETLDLSDLTQEEVDALSALKEEADAAKEKRQEVAEKATMLFNKYIKVRFHWIFLQIH